MSRSHYQWLWLTVVAILITITLGSRNSVTNAADASPTLASPTPSPAVQTMRFTEIHMADAANGWAVVTTPDPHGTTIPGQIYAGSLGTVLHTQDGGQTWVNVTPPLAHDLPEPGYGCDCTDNGLAGFFFLDANHAWVMMNDGGIPGNQAYLGINVWRTADGGRVWKRSAKPINAPSVLLANFIDASHGWLLLPNLANGPEAALLYRSNDGGLTWELIADDGTYPHYVPETVSSAGPISTTGGITASFHTGMVFESAHSGWIILSDGDPTNGRLLHTIDGGKTWAEVDNLPNSTDIPSLEKCGGANPRVSGPGLLTFFVNCDYSQRFIYRTIDDGKTWQSIQIPQNLAVVMLNATSGWLITCDIATKEKPCDSNTGYTLTLSRTENAGRDWVKTGLLPPEVQPIYPSDVSLSQLDFVDNRTGWVIDNSGRLLRTRDAGKTWEALPLKIVD